MNSTTNFEAEHLLSLEISSGTEKSVARPEEAIIRLHQLDFSKCLKPTKVVLRLEPSELSIVDQKAGYTIERIPYSSITPCQEVFVKSVNDKHPNLALITVGDSFDIVPAEFYIFQFANTSAVAKDFVQKINEFRESRERNLQSNKNILATADKPEKSDATRIIEDQAQRTAYATQRYKKPVDYPNVSSTLFFASGGSGPPTPNADDQIMDKYLDLLNKSLDDVEKFVSRLQQAAVAYQELEDKRRQSRRMSGNEENMLIIQARPPPPKDYFDIFQKIKFTFNLLAKLKGSIRNPTASEMVHYIFHPLDLIVEASCAILGPDDQPLWEHVLNPLLTPEAVTFLEDCLSTKEVELWRSLGSAWNISSAERDFWLNCIQEIPMYVPVFYDGYSPLPSVLGEVCPKLEPRGQAPTTFNKPARQSRYLLDAQTQPQKRIDTSPFRPNELQHQGLVSRRSNSPQLFRSSTGSSPRWSPTYPIQPLQQPPPPLSQASPAAESSDLQKEFIHGLLVKGAKVFIVTSDRNAENNMELSVATGQVLEVLETNRFNSKVRNSNGIIGYVPSSIIAPYIVGNGSLEADLKNRHSYIDGEKGQKSAIDNLNEEFQSKIRSDAEPMKKKNVLKSSSGVITDKSTSEEVTNWLAQKGFSEPVQSSLASFGGKQLFVMDKTVLEKLFGFDVGSRLYSQILVQKNLCGYKTMRAKELQSILEQRKKKADSIFGGNVFKSNDRQQTNSQLFSASVPPLVSEQL